MSRATVAPGRRPSIVASGSFWAPGFAAAGLASVGALALGAAVAASPAAAIALALGCGGVALAATRPTLLLATGVLLLAVEPAEIFGAGSIAGQAQTYKLVLYACVMPLLLRRGVAARKCAPLVAYVVASAASEALGTPLPGLTGGQTAASLGTLGLAWLVFAIDWDWRRDHPLLKVLAWMPIASVLLGVALQGAGVASVFRDTSPPRLQGATIAAWLASFGVCAVIACIVLHRREGWRWARWLAAADVAILAATFTRGAALALGIAAIPTMSRFARRQLSTRGSSGVVKLAAVAAVTLVAAAVVIPALLERGENATVYVAGQGSAHEVASGRFRAWAFAYEQAQENLAFGRGMGAGPIVGKSPGSPADFTAQHNEYVRMLLEVGFVGGAIILFAMIATIASAIGRAPPQVRVDLAAAAVAFAIYSLTENTLSATPIGVAWLLVVGVSSCSSHATQASSHRPKD